MALSRKKYKVNLGTFDLMKGIGMIGIVAGHAQALYPIDQLGPLIPFFYLIGFINFGVNSMFYCVSGFGFKEKPVKAFLKKTFSELLVPYLIVTLCVTILFPFFHFLTYRNLAGALHEAVRYALAYLLGIHGTDITLFGYSLAHCYVVWFLVSLFVALNVLNLIVKVKNQSFQILLVALCAILGLYLQTLSFAYFCIPQGLQSVAICYIGHLVKKHKVLDKDHLVPWICLGLLVMTLLCIIFGGFGLTLPFIQGLVKDFINYLGTVSVGILYLFVAVIISRWDWKGIEWIRDIGMHTYWIMCIHSVEYVCIPWHLMRAKFIAYPLPCLLAELLCKILIITTACFVIKKITVQKYKRRLSQNVK